MVNMPNIPIRAAVLRTPGRRLKIERLEMEGPRDDEVLVRVVASGICHTDIDFCDGGASGPVVLGREGSGVVERIGKAVKGIKLGDHVVLSYQSCGRCQPCRRGHPAGCQRFWEANFGFARLDGTNALRGGVRGHFFGQSSFATHERCHISRFAFLMRCHRGTTGMFSRSTCAGTRGVQRGCAGNQSSTLRASFSWLAVSSM